MLYFTKIKILSIVIFTLAFVYLTGSNFFKFINARLSKSEYVGGKSFSIADISAYIAIDFASWIKLVPDESHGSLYEWLEKIKLRDSINA